MCLGVLLVIGLSLGIVLQTQHQCDRCVVRKIMLVWTTTAQTCHAKVHPNLSFSHLGGVCASTNYWPVQAGKTLHRELRVGLRAVVVE